MKSNILNIESKYEKELKKLINTDTVSFAKILLLFYLLVCSSFSINLVGKEMKEYFNSNPYVDHVILILLMFVLVSTYVESLYRSIIYSIIGYLWLLFTIQLNPLWNIFSLGLIFFVFFYQYYTLDIDIDVLNNAETSSIEKERAKEEITNSENNILVLMIVLNLCVQKSRNLKLHNET